LTSATATSNAWWQTYSYDGFGNLTNRTGYGTAQSTTISTPADATTNRLSGYTYDLNGNQISTGYAYDAENRLVQANAGAVQYAYDGQNKRIWQATFSNCGTDSCMSSDSISLFGAGGKLIGTYTGSANWNNTQTQIPLSFTVNTERVYFKRKLVATLDSSGSQYGVVQDRLESVGKYYPFGEERNLPPLANDYVKFASYTRDSATSLDYADQRYYSNTLGRFMSTDPSFVSAAPANPQSWNRYSYVLGDPINGSDPQGLCTTIIGGITQTPYTPATIGQQNFADQVGAISAFPYAGGSLPTDIANVIVQGASFPTGATFTTLQSIALAAQNPGPIDIFAFSGGAQAFAEAWKLLNEDTRSRIRNITYIDPGSITNLLGVGYPGTSIAVYSDWSDMTNGILNSMDTLLTNVDTGLCGHNANCVFAGFSDAFAARASGCSIGAGSIFGAGPGGGGNPPLPIPTPTPIGMIWIPFFYGSGGGAVESVHSKIVSYEYVESEIYYDDIP
jgi:RHS repeat-associated protein